MDITDLKNGHVIPKFWVLENLYHLFLVWNHKWFNQMAVLKIFENRLPLHTQILVTVKDKWLLHCVNKKAIRFSIGPLHNILFQIYPSTYREAVCIKSRIFTIIKLFKIFGKLRFFSRNDDVTRAWRVDILEWNQASRLLSTIIFQMLGRFRPNCI